MLGERLKEMRVARGFSLEELGKKINKSAPTISRYENNQVVKQDTSIISNIAIALDTSVAFLMGMTDNPSPYSELQINVSNQEEKFKSILVTDDEMSPEIPYGALVKIRDVEPNEDLQVGSFYYIEFENNRHFRMVMEDDMYGVAFLPHDRSELRIAYDTDYVKIIGKAVSMAVYFDDDDVEFEYKYE